MVLTRGKRDTFGIISDHYNALNQNRLSMKLENMPSTSMFTGAIHLKLKRRDKKKDISMSHLIQFCFRGALFVLQLDGRQMEARDYIASWHPIFILSN